MPGVGGTHGRAKTKRIAHFTNHDDIGILPQDVLERVMERKRVQADLTLFNDALVVLENVFNRIFQCDDVLFKAGIDVLDHRRQRRGLAATRRAGHQHNAARRFGDFSDLFE